MKLGKLLLGASLLFTAFAHAQDEGRDECTRMKFLGAKYQKAQEYKKSGSYYFKALETCSPEQLQKLDYELPLGVYRAVFSELTDEAEKKAYSDTILMVFDKMEAAGKYDEAEDLSRAYYYGQSSTPDLKKADEFYTRGINSGKVQLNGVHVVQYFYNTYSIFYGSTDAAEKGKYKARMINDYFALTKKIKGDAQEDYALQNLDFYLNQLVQTCDDIVPEVPGFIENLSDDVEARKSSVLNMITLMETKECTNSDEFGMLIDTYLKDDPSSKTALLLKAKNLMSRKKYGEAIATFKELKALPDATDAEKDEYTYNIALAQYSQGSFSASYTTGMSVGGEYKGKGLVIAGKSVGARAMNCGNSTFERKCNYIYAVQLLQQGAAQGGNPGGSIASFKAKYPTSNECFDEGNPSSITLTCFGVTVNPCQ